MNVKITSKVLMKKPQVVRTNQEYFDEQWNKFLEPLLKKLEKGEQPEMPVRFYHSVVEELVALGGREVILEKVKDSIAEMSKWL
jgi:hypothetical protein